MAARTRFRNMILAVTQPFHSLRERGKACCHCVNVSDVPHQASIVRYDLAVKCDDDSSSDQTAKATPKRLSTIHEWEEDAIMAKEQAESISTQQEALPICNVPNYCAHYPPCAQGELSLDAEEVLGWVGFTPVIVPKGWKDRILHGKTRNAFDNDETAKPPSSPDVRPPHRSDSKLSCDQPGMDQVNNVDISNWEEGPMMLAWWDSIDAKARMCQECGKNGPSH